MHNPNEHSTFPIALERKLAMVARDRHCDFNKLLTEAFGEPQYSKNFELITVENALNAIGKIGFL